ncbi:hypothetical protein [Halomonas piscis]|uniref:hypothetical protein n=1 Tax=Halomonas piscis TaxID=3031727 RepID=UPI0028A12457|nr:hypothetical protein [Halomonas piscis]
MIIKAPYILKQLIDYRQHFTPLVEHMEQHHGSTEIPLRLYRRQVRQAADAAAQVSGKREAGRVLQTLAETNLAHERLIVRIDQARGTLMFAPFVLEMLRHFDVSRLQGLSQTELEDLRRGLNQSLEAFEQLPLTFDDEDFCDELRLLRRRTQDTLASIQASVATLGAQGDRLGRIVDRQDMTRLEDAAQTRHALTHINRTYRRHILPALAFLDPKTAFKQGIPATTAIHRIAHLMRDAGLSELDEELQLAANAIHVYIKDIDALRRSLERYVRQNQRQRQQYDAVENAFNRLREATEARQDDNLRHKYIPVNHPAIQRPGTFCGIKRLRLPGLEWLDIDHRADLEEFTDRRIAELRDARDRQGAVSVDPAQTSLDAADMARQQRQQEVHKLLEEWPLPDGCRDLHRALHDFLQARLADYTLYDLLDALDWVMARPELGYRAHFCHHVLTHGELELAYHPLTPLPTPEETPHA